MKTEISTIAVDRSEPAQCRWLVVSQVKSYRVVYFTDDPEYVPPMHGDWYYVSPHEGDLPKGMTLRNCWRWRFDGHAFVDASEPKPKSQEAALLNSNKEALHKLLRQKIDALRKPFAPSSLMGEQIRQAKLAEAKAMMHDGIAPPLSGYLLAVAAANASTLHNMAWRIVQQDEAQQAMLIETESLRENLASAISSATTQLELIALRERLMTELAPGLNAALKPEHTTPAKHRVDASEAELEQEKIRLRIQLREKINDLRRPYLSQYLLDDIVLKRKGQIAQAVISAGGIVPAGLDATVLISHAASRGQTLQVAANDVLTEMDEIAGVLVETEQMKDALLSKISLVKSFAEIERVSKVVRAMKVAQIATSSTTTLAPLDQKKSQSSNDGS